MLTTLDISEKMVNNAQNMNLWLLYQDNHICTDQKCRKREVYILKQDQQLGTWKGQVIIGDSSTYGVGLEGTIMKLVEFNRLKFD